MTAQLTIGGALAAFALSLATAPGTANAASAVQKECSAKYQAAKSGGTLNGMSYNQYYKQCAAEAKADKAGGATPAATPTATAPTTTAPATTAPVAAPKTTAAAPPAAAGNAVFPTAVSAQFSKETAGKARMHTCLAQYNANKANGGTGNGGLKWIMKGGGYYSECNNRLKS